MNMSKPPKYQMIADDLRKKIHSGEYPPGAKIPGENAISQRYGVATMTARNALTHLESEGLVRAVSGSGRYVREFRPLRRRAVQRLTNTWTEGRSIWAQEQDNRSLTVDGMEVDRVTPPEDVQRVLDMGIDGYACRRARRFVLDGKPVMQATSYLPWHIAEGTAISAPNTGPGGVYARLAELGHKPVRFIEEVASRPSQKEERDLLAMTPYTPVTTIRRLAFTEDNRVVEVNDMVLDSSCYILEYNIEDKVNG